MNKHIEFIKQIRRLELHNQVKEVRYWLDMMIKYPGEYFKTSCVEAYNQMKLMYKNRNNFEVFK